MARLTTTGLALILLTLLALASGCGDDPIDGYCDEVQDQQQAITEAAAAGPTGLLQALPSFAALREQAPPDIADEWAVVVQRISVLDDALDEAGVDPASFDLENPPTDVSSEDLAAIAAAASGLLTDAMTEALDGVQQQARDVCETPLSLS